MLKLDCKPKELAQWIMAALAKENKHVVNLLGQGRYSIPLEQDTRATIELVIAEHTRD